MRDGHPILTYGDIETFAGALKLRHAGAKSDAARGCGVHIHIGAQGHTPQSSSQPANIMASHESLIAEALKLDRGYRMNRYCRTVDPSFLEQVKPQEAADDGAACGHLVHQQRRKLRQEPPLQREPLPYAQPPCHFYQRNGRIPAFPVRCRRQMGSRAAIHAGQLKSYIQLCLALSQMAKDVRTASPKPQQNENPKYAMRTWLLRLGFIGEEFATARDFLTRNLSGDTAFRHGRAVA